MGETVLTAGVEFVGRRAELEQVGRALDAARSGDPRIIVVEGEPGIGKTALLRSCVAQAEDFVVLAAGGDEAELLLELGVVGQLVAQAAAPAPEGGGAASTFSAGAGLLALLGALQDTGPVLVTVDDAQWIDEASAGALRFALRRLHGDRVCVVLATRPGDPEQAGASWARLLRDDERVQRVVLGGLDGGEVGQLAGAVAGEPLSRPAAERLRAHTGGHPLYVRALLSELPPEALADEHGPLPAPHSFAATVLTRLAAVGAPTERLVAAAAVAGPRCTLELAGAAAGLGDPVAALDDALEQDLLTLVPGRMPAELTFPHPLLRAAVYDDLSPTRRRDLHLACARHTSGAAALAHRVAASAGTDAELAAELVATAEAEVAEGGLRAGIDHLLLASRLAADVPTREAALLRAVDYLGVAGDVPRSQGLRDAVAACRDGARRSFALATLTAQTGHLPEAIEALEEVTHRPDFAQDGELRGYVTSSLAIVSAYAGRGPEAVAWARRTLDAPAPMTVEVTARQALAMGLALSGRGQDGVAALGGLSAAKIAPGPFEAEMLATRGALKAWCGDPHGAVEDLDAVIGWSRRGVPTRSLANAYSSLAEAEYRLGRWDECLAHAELAVGLAQDTDQVWEQPLAHAIASVLHAGRGELEPAAAHVEAAQRAAELAPLPGSRASAAMAGAHLSAMRGDWDAAFVILERLRRDDSRVDVTHGWELTAEALLRSGRLDAATDVLDRIDREAAGAVMRVDLWRLRGELAHARGDHDAAQAAFEAAQTAVADAGSPLSEAVLDLAHGHFLRRTRRRSAATARLQAARERFEALRAVPWLARCHAELAACGVRTPAAGATDLGLSAREQVVAGLVASGMSNREVAAELYLSTKAIEYHLGNIYIKLGVRSRHQLAARLNA